MSNCDFTNWLCCFSEFLLSSWSYKWQITFQVQISSKLVYPHIVSLSYDCWIPRCDLAPDNETIILTNCRRFVGRMDSIQTTADLCCHGQGKGTLLFLSLYFKVSQIYTTTYEINYVQTIRRYKHLTESFCICNLCEWVGDWRSDWVSESRRKWIKE